MSDDESGGASTSPWPIRHELTRAIPGKDGADQKSIEFREPSAGDIMRCGFPVIMDPFNNESPVTFDEKKMSRMMAALSGLPESSLSRMSTSDWFFCATLIARFL